MQSNLIELLIHNSFDALFSAMRVEAKAKKRWWLLYRINLLQARYREIWEDELRQTHKPESISVRKEQLRSNLQQTILDIYRPLPVVILTLVKSWLPYLVPIIVVVGTIIWFIQPSEKTFFRLEVCLTSVSSVLKKKFQENRENVWLRGLRMDSLDWVHTTDSSFSNYPYLHLSNGELRIVNLEFDPSDKILIEVDEGGENIHLYLSEGVKGGTFFVDTAKITIREVGRDIISSIIENESIEFGTHRAIDLDMVPLDNNSIKLKNLVIGEYWSCMTTDANGYPFSSLLTGALYNERNELIDSLEERQLVKINSLIWGNMDVEKVSGAIKISLRGEARKIEYGDPNNLKALRNTYWQAFKGVLF